MSLVWSSGFNGMKAGITDIDAAQYIYNVEQQDGQELEYDLIRAYNDFIVGCKEDGTWNAIKASCILAGARTLNGALVPLAGTAPTNYNFASGDYNRKTGLIGDGGSKYLDSNRAVDADPRNSKHLALYISSFSSGGNSTYVGSHSPSGNAYHFFRNTTSGTAFQVACNTGSAFLTRSGSLGFTAVSRSESSSYVSRTGSSNVNTTAASVAISTNLYIFADNYPAPTARLHSNGRIAFYSIGESLNLELLDARVTTLINTIGAILP